MADEVMVVASKIRSYIKDAGLSTSAAAMPVLSEKVKQLCDEAISRARSDGRKTVLDRDFK